MSKITTHVLNTATGAPGQGIAVTLEQFHSGGWKKIAAAVTNHDGRAADLVKGEGVEAGLYKLTFAAGAYFNASKQRSFYQDIPIVFNVEGGAQHYHVPLLLSPFGYSTYRGS